MPSVDQGFQAKLSGQNGGRRVTDKRLACSTSVSHLAVACCISALAACAVTVPELVPALSAFALVTTLARILQAGALARLTGARLGTLHLALMPLKDLLQLATQVVPYFSRHVSWHGHHTRIGPGTVLLPAGWHVPMLARG